MSDVTRHDFTCFPSGRVIELDRDEGKYVLHSDYAALRARHSALVEAVKKEHAAFDSLDGAGFQLGPVGSSIWTDHAAARAEVDRLLQEEK